MDIETSFGAWLRNRRRRLGLTQEELADQVGCSAATIRKIESDLRRPSRQIATLLAKILLIEASEQALFVQVARQERLPERLAAIPSPVQPSPQLTAATVSAPIEPLPLPRPPTPLIGRETERAYLCHLLTLPECRLVTLVGPGGSGKTHLALAVAADLQGAFANGVAFVGLASLSTATLIAPALGKALGLTFTVPSEPQTQLLNYLHRKKMLILVDNMEHLLDSEDLLAELLAQTPALKLLVTSRERLNLPGEWVFDLHGLPIPPPSHPLAGAEEFTAYSSVALFVLCARRVQANFALTQSNQVHVARICQLLDGLPLGIELAAAWVRMLSCEEIAAEIEQNIDFLTVARRNVPDRHRSLRAASDHSWKLLTQAEQQALSQLALFRGGFVRAAAQAVAEAPLPLLSSLVTKSLVRRSDEGRYDLHEMTRQFAASHLHEDEPAAQAAQERHSRYFLAMVAQHKAALKGDAQGEALALLDREVDNIYQAWNWAVTNVQLDLMRQVADGLALFSLWRGRYQQGEAAFQLAVKHLGDGASGAAHRLPVLVQLLTRRPPFVTTWAKRCARANCCKRA